MCTSMTQFYTMNDRIMNIDISKKDEQEDIELITIVLPVINSDN